jgi:hypothetical protein
MAIPNSVSSTPSISTMPVDRQPATAADVARVLEITSTAFDEVDLITSATPLGETREVRPMQALSLKQSFDGFVDKCIDISLFETICLIFGISNEEFGFGDLIKQGPFSKSFDTFLQEKLSMPTYVLACTLIPIIQFFAKIFIQNSFDQVHAFLNREIADLCQKSRKRTQLLEFVAEKIDSIFQLEKKSIESGQVEISDRKLEAFIKDASLIPVDDNTPIDDVIETSIKNLSLIIVSAFHPKMDLGIEDALKSTIASLSSTIERWDQSHNYFVQFLNGCLKILKTVIKFFTDFVVVPLREMRDARIEVLCHFFMDNLMKSIVSGSLEGLFGFIEKEYGFDADIQKLINDLIDPKLLLTVGSGIIEEKHYAFTAADDEKASLKKLYKTIVNYISHLNTPQSLTGNLVGNGTNAVLTRLEQFVGDLISESYQEHFTADTLSKIFSKTIEGSTRAIDVIGLHEETANPTVQERKIESLNQAFVPKLTTFLNELYHQLVTEPVARGSASFLGACALRVTSAAHGSVNFFGRMIYNRTAEDSVAENYITPRLKKVKKLLLDPRILKVIILSTLPSATNHLMISTNPRLS